MPTVAPKPLSKNFTPKQRLEALKALVRHRNTQKKVFAGKVSEAKTTLKNLVFEEIPKTHEQCERRLKDLQQRWKDVEKRKEERSGFKSKADEAEYQILFEDIRQGTQVELPGVEVVITLESMEFVREASTTVRAQDKDRKPDDDLPPACDTAVLDQLDAALDGFIKESKVNAETLASSKQGEHPDDAAEQQRAGSRRGRPAAEAPLAH
jgi:hypothetical protein